MHTLPMHIDQSEGLPSDDISGPAGGISPLNTTSSGVDPNASVDDYNRVMLQYTQRQIEAFTQNGDNMLARQNSGTSRNSGQSNNSSITNMAAAGSAMPPRSSERDTSVQSSGGSRA